MGEHSSVASGAGGISRGETAGNAETRQSAKSTASTQSAKPATKTGTTKTTKTTKTTTTVITVITVKKQKPGYGRSPDTSSAILFEIRFALIV